MADVSFSGAGSLAIGSISVSSFLSHIRRKKMTASTAMSASDGHRRFFQPADVLPTDATFGIAAFSRFSPEIGISAAALCGGVATIGAGLRGLVFGAFAEGDCCGAEATDGDGFAATGVSVRGACCAIVG